MVSAAPAGIQSNFYLRNIWYHALPSHLLSPGKMLAKTFLNEPVLLGRTQAGKAFALRDICPHRAVPLSCGKFDGETVACCYHGWRFGPEGACREIPSLMPDQKIDLTRYGVETYPLVEQQGNLWIYMGDRSPGQSHPPRFEVPAIPGFPTSARPQVSYTMRFPCFVDHAVVGLMDPAHSPFVHQAWWWRGGKLNPEVKWFDPSPYGFTMRRHSLEQMGRAYRLIGPHPSTEIRFWLPGIRIEETTSDRHRVVNLTTVTPISDTASDVTFQFYWDIPWLALLKPIMPSLIHTFLGQDRDVVVKQQIGLQYESVLRLIKDSDLLARWYYQLKGEYRSADQDNREFISPVKTQQLRWMA